MTKIPASIVSTTTTVLHIVAVPVFFLGFILIYESHWMLQFIDAGKGDVFNALMLTCILLGILIVSRVPMTVLRQRIRMSWWQYSLWSFAEIFTFSCFAALYMSLIHAEGYFPTLGKCIQLSFTILPYPYFAFDLLMAHIRPDADAVPEEDLVRFADSTGRLKLVIAHDVILFIEAQENYVSIHYLEGETLKEYSLRSSMRGIEELMARHGIVRCQRSYFVNPRHVKVLRRDKEGIIMAELDVIGLKPVPVSPKYYEDISKLL